MGYFSSVLFLILNFTAVLCDKSSMCILVALPEQLGNVSLFWTDTDSEMSQLHTISNSEVHATTINFVSRVFHMRDGSCSDVIGIVGDLDSQTASIIHTLASRTNLSITLAATSAPSTFLPVTNLDLPNLLDMNPLQHYVEAFISFTEQLNWKRIGLITDETYYHLFAAEILQKQLLTKQVSVTPYVRIANTNQEIILQQFEEYGTEIIVLLVSNKMNCLILSEAIHTWPKRAFLIFDLELHCILRQCQNITEGVIIFKSFTYSSLLRDSIVAVTSVHNLNFNRVFHQAPGTLKFMNNSLLTNISVVQVQNGSDTVVASYNSELEEFEFSPDRLAGEEIPLGIFRIVPYRSSVLHISLVLTISVLCFIFITVNLVLYIVFRNEPEVKATSVSVSMCMFLGCYLLIIYLLTLLLQIQPITHNRSSATFICMLLLWSSTVGLSFSLIYSTLIVKMLRVYLIFCNPHSYKKKFFSNPALLLYILLLTSPIILILVLILAVDEVTEVRILNPMKSHTEAFDVCSSKQLIIWVVIMLIYNIALVIVLAILAIKSSKIRFKHFTDTKATNAFASVSIFISLMAVAYWYFLYSMPVITVDSYVNNFVICLYIAHTAEALLCQIFMFVPKVYPPTMRWFYRNEVKSK